MTRKEANYKILDRIAKYIDENPDIRFHQALQNLNINKPNMPDLFYEESELTLATIANV